jgi:hypothetical protein
MIPRLSFRRLDMKNIIYAFRGWERSIKYTFQNTCTVLTDKEIQQRCDAKHEMFDYLRISIKKLGFVPKIYSPIIIIKSPRRCRRINVRSEQCTLVERLLKAVKK